MKRITLAFVFALLAVVAANAGSQVILGNSTNGGPVFNNMGPDSESMSILGMCGSTPNCLGGLGYYGANVGNYDMWITGGSLSLGTPSGGVYPINMNGSTIHFAFNFGANFLDGNITLSSVSGGSSSTPLFIGGLYVTSSTLANYPNGAYSPLNLTISLGNHPTIDQVYLGKSAFTYGYLSSGGLDDPPLPEPGSLATLGSGLVAMAGLLGRRLFV